MFKKIIVPGLLAGLAAVVTGMMLSMGIEKIFPAIMAQYHNPGIFRAWSDPKMSIFFACPFLLGLGLAWVWDKIKIVVPGNVWKRAGLVTMGIFLISTIPGMTISYSTFQISAAMTLSWTVIGVAQAYVTALVLAIMNV